MASDFSYKRLDRDNVAVLLVDHQTVYAGGARCCPLCLEGVDGSAGRELRFEG